MAFEDIHVEGKPAALSTRTVRGASYDVRQLLRRTLALNSSAVVALRLDIEGGEWWVIEALLADDLLCSVNYMFVEFHGSATEAQRFKLPKYGIATDAFERLKERVHKAMERRGDVRAGRAVLLGKLAGGGTGAVLACWQRAPACTCICSPP